jgi:predicted nucleic acid-binding protein
MKLAFELEVPDGAVDKNLDQLRAKGFRLRDRHYDEILREVGEL